MTGNEFHVNKVVGWAGAWRGVKGFDGMLPVVDLGPFLDRGFDEALRCLRQAVPRFPPAQAKVLRQWDSALSRFGFCYVVGHHIPEQVRIGHRRCSRRTGQGRAGYIFIYIDCIIYNLRFSSDIIIYNLRFSSL